MHENIVKICNILIGDDDRFSSSLTVGYTMTLFDFRRCEAFVYSSRNICKKGSSVFSIILFYFLSSFENLLRSRCLSINSEIVVITLLMNANMYENFYKLSVPNLLRYTSFSVMLQTPWKFPCIVRVTVELSREFHCKQSNSQNFIYDTIVGFLFNFRNFKT